MAKGKNKIPFTTGDTCLRATHRQAGDTGKPKSVDSRSSAQDQQQKGIHRGGAEDAEKGSGERHEVKPTPSLAEHAKDAKKNQNRECN